MEIKDLVTEEVPKKAHYTVVEFADGKTYTIESDSTEELYRKVKELEKRASKEGICIIK